MIVTEVNSPHTEQQFLELSNRLYRNDPNRSIPLGSDVAQVFNPKKNSLHRNGKAKRWMVYDDHNLPAGRIAAFFNHDTQTGMGGMGFFECVNNEELAAALFSTAVQWLRSEGCKTAEAPINFGEKDRFWGLLIRGFDSAGLYLDTYNPPYYENLFRRFSFIEKDKISTYRVALSRLPAERIEQTAARLQKRDNIEFRRFNFLQAEEGVKAVHAVYTASFQEENRIRHITESDILELFRSMRMVLEEELIWLAFAGGQPVGLLAFMKDLNQIKKQPVDIHAAINLKGFALSVIPSYRNRGVELGLCNALYQGLRKDPRHFELYFSGINQRTARMVSFMDALHGEIVKTHQTYILNL